MDEYAEKAAGLNSASSVLLQKTMPTLKKVQDLLHEIRQAAREKLLTDETMLRKAQSIRRSATIISLIAIMIGLALAVSVASSICRPMSQAASFVERLSKSNIAREIAGVNMSSEEMATSSSQVNVSAHDLQKLASRLSEIMEQFKVSASRFDIGDVKGAHLKWRSKLGRLLRGRQALRLEEVTSHHESDFGKWYDGPDGQASKNISAFKLAGEHLEKVHAYARRIVDLFYRKENQQAASLMAEYEAEREKLFEALDKLYLT